MIDIEKECPYGWGYSKDKDGNWKLDATTPE
jgi:hypothetical protein